MDDPRNDQRRTDPGTDALRPANQRGDTERRNREADRRATEDTRDTLRPENQRADRNK